MYEVSELLNSLNEVPAMPNVIMQALNVMKNPDSGTRELGKIVSYDQSLSTKVLTLVNSSYYGFPQQITSISRAITLIGMSKTKNVIVTVAMRPMLVNHGDKELWKHSIRTAVGCEYMATRYKIMDPDEAFVIGFLHDLGKIVLNLKDAKLYEEAIKLAQTGVSILEAEKKLFGVDHCVIGSLLAKRWQLPILIANAIKYHHEPNSSSMPLACSLVYAMDKFVRDDFVFEELNEDIMKNLNMKIYGPDELRETILNKADLLLRELST